MKNKKFWRWTNLAPETGQEGEAERVLELYGTIAEDSWFDDDVTPQMFREELFAGNGPVTIWLNSPGGDCNAASQIYTALMDYKDDAGNWNLSFTFDKADLDGCSDIIVNHDDVFVTVANEEMHTILNGSFSNPRDMNMLFDAVLDSIVHYLDVDSHDDTEEVTLFMKDIFTATVSFEDGKKVYTCTPGVQIKQLIKDDSKLAA